MSARKYKDGDFVMTISLNYLMMVVDAERLLKGWKYELRFPRKDMIRIDKRQTSRWFFEDQIRPCVNKHILKTKEISLQKFNESLNSQR